MATITFFIQSKKLKTCHIYVRLCNSRTSVIKCKTGFLVETDRWSNDTQSVRQRIHTDADKRLLASLKGLREYIETQNNLFTGDKTKQWLQRLISTFHGQKDDNSDTMIGYIEGYISKAKSGDIKNRSGVNFSGGTIKNYQGFQRAFLEYQGVYSDKRLSELDKKEKKPRPRKIVDFNDITIDFYKSFVAYLSDEGYELNTMDKFIRILKYFMRKSLVDKKHNNRAFMESAFSGFSEDSHAVYLTPEEVDTLYKADLTGKDELARDAFIVMCETAVRISDYKKITVSSDNFIHLFQTKTGNEVVIPLTYRMKELWIKHNGKLPDISDQRINRLIKRICNNCKVNEIIQWQTQKHGLKFTESKEKWRLVSCHTGRRTAATNMYLAGIPAIDIMQITGHTTMESFLRYIRISKVETAQRLSSHPYFSGLRAV